MSISYADVEDANAVTTAITASNSTADNDNNTNWTIDGGTCGGNTNPNSPTSLTQKDSGDASITESAWTNSNIPKLGFTITDPDSDTVKYEVQVATDSGFSRLFSTIHTVHSPLRAQPSRSLSEPMVEDRVPAPVPQRSPTARADIGGE